MKNPTFILILLALITVTTMSSKPKIQGEMENPGDCAVFAFYAATDICNNRPQGCTQSEFNGFATIAMNHCYYNQQ